MAKMEFWESRKEKKQRLERTFVLAEGLPTLLPGLVRILIVPRVERCSGWLLVSAIIVYLRYS